MSSLHEPLTATLRGLLDRQREAEAARRAGSSDEAFHRALALGVVCDYAWRVVEEFKAQMDRVRYLSLPHATPIGRLIAQHAAIVDAVSARDPAAEAAVRVHLSEICTSLPRLARRFADMFEPDAPAPAAASVPTASSAKPQHA